MKLVSIAIVNDTIVEDYELEDSEFLVRILDSKQLGRTAFLRFKDRYIRYLQFHAFISGDYKEKEIKTFRMTLEPKVMGIDFQPVKAREVNFFIQLGCINIGKDKMIELISKNKIKIEECLQNRLEPFQRLIE